MLRGEKPSRTAVALLISLAIVMGGFLRVSFTLGNAFPINDGGLFWTMTRDLIQNRFSLPPFTTYNHASVPYAYPPGAFYLLGFLNQSLHLPLLELFRFFPLIFSILGLLLIYPIARLALTSDRQALLATFAFSVIQPAYTWALMGGGVTRSPALFFSMLAVLFTLRFARQRSPRASAAGAILSIVLTAYFHIEIAWVGAVSMALIAVYFRRSWRQALAFLGANLAGGLALLAPYWITILRYHGFGIFQQVFSTGFADPLAAVGILFIPLYTAETILHLLAVLALLGVYASLGTRQFLPVLWLVLVTLIDPRSIHRSAALPVALLVAASLDVYVLQGLSMVLDRARAEVPGPARLKLPYALTAGILTYAFLLSALQQSSNPQAGGLSGDERAALTWVEENTPADAAFLILPASAFWEGDWVSEWFPALTQRRSVLTVQGYEWLASRYGEKITAYEELAACLDAKTLCYADWGARHAPSFSYLIVQKRPELYSPLMLAAQGVLEGCDPAYQNPEIEIYRCQ